MLKIIGLWTLFGLVIQMIGGAIEGHKVVKLEQETGKKYDGRYSSIYLARVGSKVMPLMNYSMREYQAKGLTFGFFVSVVINNLWGYIIWPIYFPMMMLAYDEAHKAFLIDNKEES